MSEGCVQDKKLRCGKKPGFFLCRRRIIPEKKAGFPPRADIKNL
ncbi:Uncharacterized protein dnm_065460 [Desulfonema magnum]|uniref:Uncharacterized protein n=1 Tax=Desulfonema magnum TaxID=45655 RepID=A0A975BRY9_9BACT|nr:Uncharacterized protein dnm_065460 [Desulfonema magnum]